ncbi:MAG: PepSY-like domain-containing protein [Mediterranea sp.]|jgi:hypothetical protein|nr:PepSY-like domain-containing protein [Mediterranea sp.]
MKKKSIITGIVIVALLAIIGLVALFLDVYNDNRIIARESLPSSITNFVGTNFPGTEIRTAEIDFLDYAVWLDDDTSIEFDWNRKWDKIENFKGISRLHLIPDGIRSFTEQQYPGTPVTEISIDDNRYEVRLAGLPIELLFTRGGGYIGVED